MTQLTNCTKERYAPAEAATSCNPGQSLMCFSTLTPDGATYQPSHLLLPECNSPFEVWDRDEQAHMTVVLERES